MTDERAESTPQDTHETPDGWTREDIVAGMDTVGIGDHFDEFLGLGSGYRCRRCEHFIPIDALDDDDDTCPRCEHSGMIGTVIMGRQDVTVMYPDGWFDEEDEQELVTDGGHDPEDRPDPEDDPFACSKCGGYLGELERMNGSYCESCKVETEPHVVCEECGDRLPQSRASNLDVSPDDEYYPEFIYFCPTHAPGTGDQELVTDGGEEERVLAETQTAGFGFANGKVVERLLLSFDRGTPAARIRRERVQHPDPMRDGEVRRESRGTMVVNPHDTHRDPGKLEIGTSHGRDRVIAEWNGHAPRAYVRHERREDGEWTRQAEWELHPAQGVQQVGDGTLVTDGGHTPVKKREWITGQLNAVSIVEWDRFVVMEPQDKQFVDVYGWIDRDEDEYKDFVWTRFYPDTGTFEYTTSSDEYTDYLADVWFDEDDDGEHNPCRRVEDGFPEVENAIELTEDSSLTEFATDGGTVEHEFLDPVEEAEPRNVGVNTMRFFAFAAGNTLLRQDRLESIVEYWLLHYHHSRKDRDIRSVSHDSETNECVLTTTEERITVENPKETVVMYASMVVYGKDDDLDEDIRAAREEHGMNSEPEAVLG